MADFQFDDIDLQLQIGNKSHILLESPESIQGDNKLVLLRRCEIIRLRQTVKQSRIVSEQTIKRVLYGPAGCGKTLVLYLCALDCLQSQEWLVFYVPELSKFDGVSDFDCARNLIDNFRRANDQYLRLNQINADVARIQNLLDDALAPYGDPVQALSTLFQNLLHIVDVPVFIGLDQWNCLADGDGINQSLLKKLWGHFSKINVGRGCCMCAMSSTFPVRRASMFRDFDAVLTAIDIDLYSDEEWRAVVSYNRERGQFPSRKDLHDDKLQILTGRVPRLLESVKQSYLANGCRWSQALYGRCVNQNVLYFAERARSVIKRNREGCYSVSILRFASLVVLNQYERAYIPSEWIDSGLFEKENGFVTPICQSFLTAMFITVCDDIDEIISIMATSDREIAFKVLVITGLSQQQSTQFQCCTLAGETDITNVSLRALKVDVKLKPSEENVKSLYEEDTLIICHGSYQPPVDAVIYCDGFILLISVSLRSYFSHSTRARDIFTQKIGLSGYNVLQHYCKHSPYGKSHSYMNETVWSQHLADHVRFIYITADSTKHDATIMKQSGAQYVRRVKGDQLEKLGESYKYFMMDT
ncbi:hypothetical protein MIR68_007042 [Amoeboaphelidium protococcarum]|nr:hypothetical protein MIR68_007042 [Amoeboaphelidium protococcarum]